MNAKVTLDTVQEALNRLERHQHTAEDVALLREWIASQEATIAYQESAIATQAKRITELKRHEGALTELLDEEA